MRITYLYHLILVVLLVSLFISSDGAKKKKRKSKKNDRVNEADSADNSSEREKHSRIAGSELNSAGEPFSNNRGGDTLDPSLLTDDPSLQAEENELRVNLLRAIVNHGDDSLEKATALHVLGRNLYHQRKYSYVAEVSNEIVRIHEKIDGSESIQVALALGNVGSVSFRMGNKNACRVSMNRALYIFIQVYGEDSNEVLLHRAKMLTFQIKEGRSGNGLSYKDYKDYL